MNDTFEELPDLHFQYVRDALDDNKLPDDPAVLFADWFRDARTINQRYNECALATASSNGTPSVRIVLLKRFDSDGFCWFSDSSSQKGCHLAQNPRAELLFYWQQLERQIRIYGIVTELDRRTTSAYFASRPLASQVSTLISHQSQPIANRQILIEKHQQAAAHYPKAVPCPTRWRGYCLKPKHMEFWQGREHRLHDRILYQRTDKDTDKNKDTNWQKKRLQP